MEAEKTPRAQPTWGGFGQVTRWPQVEWEEEARGFAESRPCPSRSRWQNPGAEPANNVQVKPHKYCLIDVCSTFYCIYGVFNERAGSSKTQRLGLGFGFVPGWRACNILILCLVRRTNGATCKPPIATATAQEIATATTTRQRQHRPRAEALKNRTKVGWLRAAYNIFVSDLVTLNQSSRWGITSMGFLVDVDFYR